MTASRFHGLLSRLHSTVCSTFSLTDFKILSLFCAFGILNIMWWEEYLFWANLFGVLYASCMFMGISFFMLGSFSSMIFFEDIFWPFKLGIFALFLYLFSLGLVFSLCPGFPGYFQLGVFCILHFLWLLCQCFLWYLLHLRFSLLSLIYYWWCSHLQLLVSFLGFVSTGLSPFVIFFIVSTSIFRSWMVLFNSFTCSIVFSCSF